MLNSRVICVHAYLSLLSTLEVLAMICHCSFYLLTSVSVDVLIS